MNRENRGQLLILQEGLFCLFNFKPILFIRCSHNRINKNFPLLIIYGNQVKKLNRQFTGYSKKYTSFRL